MSESLVPRSWPRIAAEAVVIVGSILLAFAIDAGWQGRLDRLEEGEALAALEDEFRSNLAQVDRVIGLLEADRSAFGLLIALPDDSITALPQRRVSELMVAIANPRTFDPVLGTTDALIGAGRLGILRDSELREALTTFLNFLADMDEDRMYMQASARDLWAAEIDLGGPWTDPEAEESVRGLVGGLDFIPRASAADLRRVRSDDRYMRLGARHQINTAYYVFELNLIRGQIHRILALLEASS